MRLFFGIRVEELSLKNHQQLRELRSQLDLISHPPRWVPPENFHLSLAFLGEVEEEKLPQLKLILEEATQDAAAFDLKFTGVGAFPGTRSARVLWVGVERSEALYFVQKSL